MGWLVEQVGSIFENVWLLFGFFFILALANIFFPPLPLESTALFAGYLSGRGYGALALIIAAIVSGSVLGSFLLYLLARKYGYEVISKTPLKRVVTPESLGKAEGWFKKYGIWAIFFGKIIPGMSFYTILCCGALKLRPYIALPSFFVSNLIFYSILVILGLNLGENWESVLWGLQKAGRWLLIGGGVIGAGYFWFRIRKRPRPENR